MRNLLIILSVFLFASAGAYQKVYLQKNLNQRTYQPVYRPVYNPYSYQYYNPYQYSRINSNNPSRIRRLNLLRQMNRRRNVINNFLSWNNNKGGLTGYSVPVIKDDVYKQMGISPYDPKSKNNTTHSPTCDTDLFSSPQGDEMYYTNGEKRVNLGGAKGKTGVTIIYD